MIAFRNPLFDGQLRRTLSHGTYGGAELGECLATASGRAGAWLSRPDLRRSGQGQLLIERSIPFRPDWEKVISAVIDLAVSRDDVDVSKIALIGESWGGYLAPRGAAYDRRVALCVLEPAQIGLFRAMLSRLPLPVGLKRRLPHGSRWLVMLLRALMARNSKATNCGLGASRRHVDSRSGDCPGLFRRRRPL